MCYTTKFYWRSNGDPSACYLLKVHQLFCDKKIFVVNFIISLFTFLKGEHLVHICSSSAPRVQFENFKLIFFKTMSNLLKMLIDELNHF